MFKGAQQALLVAGSGGTLEVVVPPGLLSPDTEEGNAVSSGWKGPTGSSRVNATALVETPGDHSKGNSLSHLECPCFGRGSDHRAVAVLRSIF